MTYTSLQNKAAGLSWGSPRDTGGNRVPETQRNIDYGWITALATDYGKKSALCSRSSTTLKPRTEQEQYVARRTLSKMHAHSSAAAQAARVVSMALPVMPAGKDSDGKTMATGLPLCPELAHRTTFLAMQIACSLARFDAQLDDVMARAARIHVRELQQSNQRNIQQVARLQQTSISCSMIVNKLCSQWNRTIKEYWGANLDEMPQIEQASDTTALAAARQAAQQLTRILLVEGALLFSLSQFDKVDNVRKLIESCNYIVQAIDHVEAKCNNIFEVG